MIKQKSLPVIRKAINICLFNRDVTLSAIYFLYNNLL